MIKYSNLSQDSIDFNIESFKKIIPQDSVAIDIGAHSGYFSLIFGECVGENGKVISFEPNPQVFKNLLNNKENNPHLNITPYELACTKENKKYIFNYSDPNIYKDGVNGGYFDELSSKNEIKDFHYYQIEVNGVNLDDFLNDNHKSDLDKIKFIKIDAEGYDKEIIKTLSKVISNSHPVLMVEAFRNLNNEEVKDFYNTLNDLEYLIYDASPHNEKDDCVGPLSENEFGYYLHQVMNGENFLCFHKDDIKKFNLSKTIPGKTAAVAFGRNDGYKEKERFIIHLTSLLETFDEVIYVDWNSPMQSFIYEIMDELPKSNKLKHIVISKEIHKLFADNIPDLPNCYDSLALNIALRRTDAEWVVVTTLDIVPPFKEDFNKFLSTCDKNTFYTLSRREVEYSDIIKNKHNLKEYREYLNKTSSPRYFPAKVTPNDNYSIINCCGDFQLATKNIFLKLRGYEENMCYKCFTDTNIQKKAVLYGFKLKAHYDLPLYHMSHANILPQSHTDEIHSSADKAPPKYNDAWAWVEAFDGEMIHGQRIHSKNSPTWGLSDVEIEFEII